jgi:hypothetical protein
MCVEIPVHFYMEMRGSTILLGKVQAQLQKPHHTCFVTPGKKFIIGGIFAMLHLEVT